MLVFLMLYLCLLIAQELETLSEATVYGEPLENPSPEYTTKMEILGAPSPCINPKKYVKTVANLNNLKTCCQLYINTQLSASGPIPFLTLNNTLKDCLNSHSVEINEDFEIKQCPLKEHNKENLICYKKGDIFITVNKIELTFQCFGDRWIYLKNESEYYDLNDNSLNLLYKCGTSVKAHANGYCEDKQLHLNSKCKVIESGVEKEFICKKSGWISITPNAINYTSQMKELGAPTICNYPEESVDTQTEIDSLKDCCNAYIKEHIIESNTIEQIQTRLSNCVNNVNSSLPAVDFRQCKEITDTMSNDFGVETNGNKKTLNCLNGKTFRYFNEAEITLRCVGQRWVYLIENAKFYVMSDEKVKSLECETIEKNYDNPTCNSNLVDESTQCKVNPIDKTYVCQNKIWEDITSQVNKAKTTPDKVVPPGDTEEEEEVTQIGTADESQDTVGKADNSDNDGTDIEDKADNAGTDTQDNSDKNGPETQDNSGNAGTVTEDNSGNAGKETQDKADKDGTDTQDKADKDGTDTQDKADKETDGYSPVCPVVLITLFSMML